MVEPVPAAPLVCALCGGEGFTFQQLEDRGVAVACSCTRNCPSCHGQGRLYARDERGYEVLRGCGCGADPRRLSLLTGLRRVHSRLRAGARACSDSIISAAPRALLRMRRRAALRTSPITAASGTPPACQESASCASAGESRSPRPRTLESSCAMVSMYSLPVKK